jgi:hypothetical protein
MLSSKIGEIMKLALKSLFCLCVLSICSVVATASEWRGIVPLHSTRNDVTRILGESSNANHIRASYSLKNEDVYIVFGGDEDYAGDCGAEVPTDTVILLQITPKKDLRLSDLPFDVSKFRKFDPSEPKGIGFEGFIDDENGIVVRASKGKVDQISYIATAKERRLCPKYYENPEDFVRIMLCGLGVQ